MVHQDRKQKAIDLPGGNCLALQVNRRKKQRPNGSSDGSTWDFTAKLVVELAAKKSRLVISVNQAQFAAGSFLSIPRLAVHNVVSRYSPIFQLARQGKVEDILDLVGNGQASFHDRDEEGWSLLHVSSVGHTHLTRPVFSRIRRLTYLLG